MVNFVDNVEILGRPRTRDPEALLHEDVAVVASMSLDLMGRGRRAGPGWPFIGVGTVAAAFSLAASAPAVAAVGSFKASS